MKTTLMLEYKYPYGLINSLWGAKERFSFIPDRIILASTRPTSRHAKHVVAMLQAWQRGHGLEPDVQVLAFGDDPAATRQAFLAALRSEEARGADVAVDVTNGRTIPKLALYHAALEADVRRVYYLDVKGYDYRPIAYPLIPRRIQQPLDLDLEEIHGS